MISSIRAERIRLTDGVNRMYNVGVKKKNKGEEYHMPRGNTPEQRRARNIQGEQWDKENTKQVKFKFNLRTDADILARLAEQSNVQGYVKALIRADIARNSEK